MQHPTTAPLRTDPPRRFARGLALALGTWALVAWLVRLDPPTAGEPLPWRWARSVAAHPVRSVLALCLLIVPGRPRAAPDRARKKVT